MKDLIKEIQDIDNGLTAVIYRVSTGYSVSLRDDDARENVGIFRVFGNLEDATKYAYTITGLTPKHQSGVQ